MEKNFIRILTAVAFVFLGIMLLINRDSFTDVIIIALGAVAICYSIMNTIEYVKTKKILTLILAIVLGILGTIFVLQPVFKFQIYNKILGVLLALAMIFLAVVIIKESISKVGNTKIYGIVLGIFFGVIGVITLFKPGLQFISVAFGIASLIFGGTQLYDIIKGDA